MNIIFEIRALHDSLSGIKAHKKVLCDSLRRYETERLSAEKMHDNNVQARIILQEAAERTQKLVEVRMSKIVSAALADIAFDNPYQFLVRFVQRRNKTECDLLFIRDGEEFQPLESAGGGALDVASMALRVAFWTIRNNRATIILDEPFRFLSPHPPELRQAAGELLRNLSRRLNIQFIIVTHLQELLPYADNVIEIESGTVVKEGGV